MISKMDTLYVHYMSDSEAVIVKEISYQKLYTTLFNAITDALQEIDMLEITKAKQLLIEAQQKTEEMYIEEAQ